MDNKFSIIKSIIVKALCRGVCLGKTVGVVSQDELNTLGNKYTDKIICELNDED